MGGSCQLLITAAALCCMTLVASKSRKEHCINGSEVGGGQSPMEVLTECQQGNVNIFNISNPDDCGSYYVCSENQYVTLKCCPLGLHYNTLINQCDNPSNVDCGTRPVEVIFSTLDITRPDTTLENTFPTTTDTTVGYDTTLENTFPTTTGTTTANPVTTDFTTTFTTTRPGNIYETCLSLAGSPEPIKVPNYENCNSYYECYDGQPTLYQCGFTELGDRLVYDPVSETCVDPAIYPCSIF